MINQTLFNLLKRRFGEGVHVHKEGQPNDADYSKDPLNSIPKYKWRLNIRPQGQGEEYSVSCPFCSDTRGRLAINHVWGVFDQQTNTYNLWLAQCYNENCLADYGIQKELYDQVYGFTQIGRKNLNKPTQAAGKSKRLFAIKPPGPLWRVDDMKRRSPMHPAIDYLEERLFDPLYLGRAFHVAFCSDSSYPMAVNRLIAPIYMRGVMVGWQARWISDPGDRKIPKWWTSPGMPLGSSLYNYDAGILHQTKVLVEGPADVWGFGRQAMGVFGKTLGAAQKKLLLDGCKDEDTVVLLLDPSQDATAKKKGSKHHQDVLLEQLNQTKLKGRVVKVMLPEPYDPGELDREYMRDLIRTQADIQGVPVSFKPPARMNHSALARALDKNRRGINSE